MEPPRMASQPYIPFFYQDFDFGTKNFTYAQKGFYLELLCIQWDRGEITQKHFSKAKKDFSEEEFLEVFEKFEAIGNGFQNKRLEKTRKEVNKRSKIAKQNGKLGGRPVITKPEANDNLNESKHLTQTKAKDNLSNPNPNPNPNLNSNTNIKLKIKDSLSPKKSTKKPPSFPWPDDFTLTIHLYDYAKKQGIPNPEEEFENFRLNAMAKSYVYADWSSAWMKWCRDDRTNKKPKEEDYV